MALQQYAFKNIRSAAILTTSYVAGTVWGPGDTGGTNPSNCDQLMVLIKYTKGDSTSLEVKVEFSHNGTDYYQETFGAVSGGTETDTLGEHTYTASGNYRIPIQIKDNYIKISAKCTGTVTSSSCTIDAVVGTTA